jgi:hypothetical protein
MYTKKMSDEFQSLKAPKNFGVKVFDADNFITVLIAPEQIINLSEEEAKEAIEYVKLVKQTFEKHGAIVHIVRPPVEQEDN